MKRPTTGWSSTLNSPARSHHWLFYWVPALLWLGMIACFSTSTFSASNTGGVLEWILKTLHVTLTSKSFNLLHFLIRKTAHFSVYGLLSALFFRAWRGEPQVKRWKLHWALLALLVCGVAASSDEYHQSFTPGRTAAVTDVELDMTGALFAQLMIVAWTARRIPAKQKAASLRP